MAQEIENIWNKIHVQIYKSLICDVIACNMGLNTMIQDL